jgi:hypothetical protein
MLSGYSYGSARKSAWVKLHWEGYYQLFQIPADVDTFYSRISDQINSLSVSTLDEKGFYALVIGKPESSRKFYIKNLAYIGKAYSQTLRQRIPQYHQGYDCITKFSGSYLYLTIGTIEDYRGVETIRKELYDDIECCLIFESQPECNISCKDGYNSKLRRGIKVINSGKYQPLRQTCLCSY